MLPKNMNIYTEIQTNSQSIEFLKKKYLKLCGKNMPVDMLTVDSVMVTARTKSEQSANFETQECWLVGSRSKYGNSEVKILKH